MPNPASTGLPNPQSYTTNADGTITDNVTGLVWEDPMEPPPTFYTQAQATLHCAAKGGAWRLPTVLELVSLVDYTVAFSAPTIDLNHFPNTRSYVFRTSSPRVGVSGSGPTLVWTVDFSNSRTTLDDETIPREVRCLNERLPRCYSPPYQALAGGLVYDRATGLTWQQTTDASSYTWSDALSHCSSLGAGWRAPSLTELQTIVDYTVVGQALDGIEVPPASIGSGTWSSTPYALDPTEAAAVWYGGGTDWILKTQNRLSVRCVR
jgi:hypothetical protein